MMLDALKSCYNAIMAYCAGTGEFEISVFYLPS
jgi:hypothetical protein